MKRLFLSLFALLTLVSASQAQTTTFTQDLDQVIALAQDCRSYARNTRDALRSLAVQYFQLGNPNPNVSAYLAVMDLNMGLLESAQDDIYWLAGQAKLKNPAIDVTDIQAWASQLEAREDYVRIQSANLANAIAANNVPAARAANNLARGYLTEQIAISNDIIASAQAQKLVPQTYTVRTVLVNSQGQPLGYNPLAGNIYGIDPLGNYIWPTNQEGDLFEGLSAGTYTFDAIPGYFDGASGATVTLTPALINANGEVIVNLVYWSE
jgi:hypothetical protein